MVVLGQSPHRGPATLARRSEGEAAVRVLRSVLGASHGAGAAGGTALRLLESLDDLVAYEAGGGDPSGLAGIIEEAARV